METENNASNIIEISELNKWYGDFHALKNINMSVKEGEIIVVCGPSGSGKSTLIRCVNFLEKFQEGNIVGSSISLFKDTTLVLIIGLMDMLAMVNMTSNDPYWLGRETEGFVFVTMVFWVILYSMSRYSRKLEIRFNTENIN